MLYAPDKFRRKSAIETISKGKRTLLVNSTQSRRTVENFAYDLFILFRLKATGAVNKRALQV